MRRIFISLCLSLYALSANAQTIIETAYVTDTASPLRNGTADGFATLNSANSSALGWYDVTNGVARSTFTGYAGFGNASELRSNNAFGSIQLGKIALNGAVPAFSAGFDLGTNALVSDVSGYDVTDVSLQVIDFSGGSMGFSIGLWDGATLTPATSLSQLDFSVTGGTLTYTGGTTFLLTDSTPNNTAGTTVVISSAVNGSYVRTLESAAGSTVHSFPGDFVNFAGERVLTAVPEPTAFVLLGGTAAFSLLRRRRKA